MEWVPREENAFADELSKLLIPDCWMMLARKFFDLLEVSAIAVLIFGGFGKYNDVSRLQRHNL
jgi:hypothetical protein